VEDMNIGEFARRSRLSPKALRLYDEMGLLPPSRVDEFSGYRYYASAQVGTARLISALRQLEFPLATIKELLGLPPEEIAERISALWRGAEQEHLARRRLAGLLVDQLMGRKPIMYEVATRVMPQRSLLCVKRNVGQADLWEFGKQFMGILRDRRLPRLEGREGAAFCIYWGEVTEDSDGPVEWCKPVPDAEAESVAAQFPELTLRIEPAHHEAYVALGAYAADNSMQWPLVEQALRAWAEERGIDREQVATGPEDLGVRMTYLFDKSAATTDCDFALPFTE
jgi:DNA-binding transcriptional MerR regulator